MSNPSHSRWLAATRAAWRRRPDALEHGSERRFRVALIALIVGDAAYAFQQTAVIPALPTISRELGARATWTAWLLSGYLIVASLAAPLIGRLGDRFGKRRLLVISLLVFLVGSVGAALSPSIGALIAFRALQGVGGAVFPLSFAVVRDEFPPVRVGGAIGVLTGGFGIGSAAGMALGGVIASASSWRWVFLVGAILILAATALVETLVPRSPDRAPSRIDAVGALLLGGGLAALLVGLTEGPTRGWESGAVVGSFAAAAVLLAALGAWSRRAPHPLVDLAVLRRPAVLSANVVSFVLGYALFGTFFLVPTLVEGDRAGVGYGFGVGAIGAGLFLLPAAIGQVVAGPLAGRVARARQPRVPLVAGMALLAAGAAILAVGAGSKEAVLGGMLALGLGFGSSLTPASTLVTQAVSARESGVASALNSVVRRVGGGVGGQVGAALLAAITVTHSGDPSRAAFTAAFAVTAAIGALGLLCAAIMPGDRAARV